jgi:hypothetical protein
MNRFRYREKREGERCELYEKKSVSRVVPAAPDTVRWCQVNIYMQQVLLQGICARDMLQYTVTAAGADASLGDIRVLSYSN